MTGPVAATDHVVGPFDAPGGRERGSESGEESEREGGREEKREREARRAGSAADLDHGPVLLLLRRAAPPIGVGRCIGVSSSAHRRRR